MEFDSAFAARLSKAAGAALVPVVAIFMVMRLLPGRLPLIVAQIVFLLPVAAAVASTAWAHRVAPSGAEKRVWGLLSIASIFLFSAEFYFSGYQVAVSAAGPPSPSYADAANLAAAFLFMGVVGVSSGLGTVALPGTLRVMADGTALVAVGYAWVFHTWVRYLVAPEDWTSGAMWAAYSVVGLALVGAGLWLRMGMRGQRVPRRGILVGASVAVIAVGMILSPVWQSQQSQGVSPLGAAVVGGAYLVGYYLMALAGLARVAEREDTWRNVMSRETGSPSIWPSSMLAACVLVSITFIAWWAYWAPAGQQESALYVIAGTVATLAFVARTGFLAMETGRLEQSSATDPVTGAFNHRAFQEHCASEIASSRRRGEDFAVGVLDLDGFARVNSEFGHAAGDEILARVARSLEAAAGARASVYRLSGDEFGVIAPGVGESVQIAFGSRLLEAVRRVEAFGAARLSASVGVAWCDPGVCSRDDLVRRAEAAQAWAKYHGKDRVVAYDERIVRALGVEERLRLQEERSHLDIARALSAAADARDPQNYYHSRNVAALSLLLAEASGMEPDDARKVEIAAMLHDVGKIALGDDLLGGVDLSAAESASAREHTVLGSQLVESIGVEGLPLWVRSHHERWDGEGYPDGLAGDDIALQARIISLADAYDGMTSGKRGGRPMSKAAALQEIDHGMGTRFDPDLAEKFITIVGMTSSLGWSDEWPDAS